MNYRKCILFGLLLGIIIISPFTLGFLSGRQASHEDMQYMMLIGFTVMGIGSLLGIVLGVYSIRKTHTDKWNFGTALLNGLLIALIGALIYATVWVILCETYPAYLQEMMTTVRGSIGKPKGATLEDVEMMENLFKSPGPNFAYATIEYLWIGVIFALISAAIFRKK